MKRKSIVLLALIGVIILAVGAFFVIKLARDTIFVYEEPPTPAPSETLPSGADPAITANMDEIEAQVSQLRGLEIDTQISRQLMTRDELEQVVIEQFFAEYDPEQGEHDAAVMNLFGLLPADFDLYNFYLGMYSEQIAGYYDSKETAMYVITESGFGGMERSTYAHEFVHALQDFHFDFEGKLGYTDELCKLDSERCAALQSLIEGDATLTQQLWFQEYGTQEDLRDLQEFATTYQSPVFDSAPLALSEALTFPYVYGATFIQTLYAQGGFAAVDAAFTSLQPHSSEQIMHPNTYPEDVPQYPPLPNLEAVLGQGWAQIDTGNLGEYYVYLVLAKGYNPQFRLFDSLAQGAAEGWGGDTYSVVKNTETGELAGMVALNWDTSADAKEAFEAFSSYSDLRFGAKAGDYWAGESFFSSLLQTSDNSFVWLISQDLVTLEALQEAAR